MITPSRTTISERFPIASFMVRAPGRHFEVACATDPALFHTDYADRRTSNNFYSSRVEGLHYAGPEGVSWFIPTEQLKRFAGAQRIYYALGTYGGRNGEDPRFSVAPQTLHEAPSIRITRDFTGRNLDRRRFSVNAPASEVYGAPSGARLRWGGDAVLEAERRRAQSPSPRIIGYDDGFDPALWRGVTTPQSTIDPDYRDDGLSATTFDVKPSSQAEPEGFEHGPDIRGSDTPATMRFGSVSVPDSTSSEAPEPRGYADGSELRLEKGVAAEPAGYEHAPSRAAAAYGRPTRGKHHSYREDDFERSLPVGPAARPLSARVLEIVDKVRILRIVGAGEPTEDGSKGYSAYRADPEFEDPNHPAFGKYHLGLSWGFVMFTQRSGLLGRVLRLAKMREVALRPPNGPAGALPEAHTFERLFGPDWQTLMDTLDPDVTPNADERVQPIGPGPVWKSPWLDRFVEAGAVPYVQAAQNEVAIKHYFDPIAELGGWLGIRTARGIAVLLDRAVDSGVGGGRDWIMSVVGPVRSEADRSAALTALGTPNDLAAFQKKAHIAPSDGAWNARTHAAMTGALRALGAASPLPVMAPDAMLDALARAAESAGFGERLAALRAHPELDASVTYEL